MRGNKLDINAKQYSINCAARDALFLCELALEYFWRMLEQERKKDRDELAQEPG
jgi:hypothetical protein